MRVTNTFNLPLIRAIQEDLLLPTDLKQEAIKDITKMWLDSEYGAKVELDKEVVHLKISYTCEPRNLGDYISAAFSWRKSDLGDAKWIRIKYRCDRFKIL